MMVGKLRMGLSGHVKCEGRDAYINIGDPIQAYATTLLYQKIGIERNRIVLLGLDELKSYDGPEIIFPLPLNLSIESIDDFFPLSIKINPIFVSQFYVNDFFEGRDDIVTYFKEHEPIGCRDEKTRNLCRKYDIEAYLMGDFSFIYSIMKQNKIGNKVFLTDLSVSAMEHIPDRIKENAVSLSHAQKLPVDCINHDEDDREYNVAKEYIDNYKNNAKLVVSSRLHAVVPAMAMGIPVILMSDNIDYRYEWIDKFIPLYQIGDYDKIAWNPKPIDTEWITDEIIRLYHSIVVKNCSDIDDVRNLMKELDDFYMDRRRSDYYGNFIDRIKRFNKSIDEKEFRYILWGAGIHCSYAKELVDEFMPNGRLVGIVDKFKEGTRYGVDIVRGDDIKKGDFDCCLITSALGRDEAKAKLCELYGEDYEKICLELCSQQLS